MKSLNEDKILGEVDISDVSPTGRTRHTVDCVPVTNEIKLRLMRLAGDTSIYLIHYGPNETELTDTCHLTIEEALDQASFEYGIAKSDWNFFEES